MKIVEAHQVPMGNVSPDIFALPCVEFAYKVKDQTWYDITCCKSIMIAIPTRWICKTDNGEWIVLTNEEYEKATEATQG